MEYFKTKKDWFKDLTGIKEDPEEVRSLIEETSEGDLKVLSTGKILKPGTFESVSLESNKNIKLDNLGYESKLKISQIVGDISDIISDPANNNCVVQVASQFNCLEMTSPEVTPEMGITRYVYDSTQGPACSIACGAGTIYRNYFLEVNYEQGQTAMNQLNTLQNLDIELQFGHKLKLGHFVNGYYLNSIKDLEEVEKFLLKSSSKTFERLKGLIRVGIQRNTEVTINDSDNIITQVFCSAYPLSYNGAVSKGFTNLTRLLAESFYESTLYEATKNFYTTGNNKVFLSLVGCGVFGNDMDTTISSLLKACNKFKKIPLDIKIVSYKYPNEFLDFKLFKYENSNNTFGTSQ